MVANPDTRASLILRLSDPEDDVAWNEFVQIYEPMLFRLASRWGMQDADAREVVQETLLSVAGAVSRFSRRSTGSFRGWLAAIARNNLVDHLKDRASQVHGSGDTDVHRWLDQHACDGSSESVWDWELKRQMFAWAAERVRTQVSESTWLAFYRTSVAGHDVSQVAADLGMRPGMVYVARSRVMARLRKAIQSWNCQQERC